MSHKPNTMIDPMMLDLQGLIAEVEIGVKDKNKVILTLITTVGMLQKRVTKLSGWLTEHESMLAKSRNETNTARRKLTIERNKRDYVPEVTYLHSTL